MDPSVVTVPPDLASATARSGDPARTRWLLDLPRLVTELAERWDLDVAEPFEPGGSAAWVAPARDAAGRDAVLKVAWTHAESRDEAAGLAAWAGHGAVDVYAQAVDGPTTAMLLGRCRPGADLRTQPRAQQHRVIGELLRRLHAAPLPVGHAFRPLTQLCDEWGAAARRGHARAAGLLDPALVRDGLALWEELPRTADEQVLLCTDLHAGNVLSGHLSGQRSPWLLIDPKPYVGDPHYDVVQHLLNCDAELHADPVALVRTVCEAADLQEERVLRWLFARCVQESVTWPVLAPVARRLSTAALR